MPLAIETRTSLHQLLLLRIIIVVVCLQNNEAQDDGCSSPNFLRSLLLIMKQVVLLLLLPLQLLFCPLVCDLRAILATIITTRSLSELPTDHPLDLPQQQFTNRTQERDGVVSLWNKRKQWRGRGGEYSKSLADYFAPLEKNRSTYLRVVCETDSGK